MKFLPQNAIQESLATLWPHLSLGYRSVFRYLQWKTKKNRHVFPSLDTIARAAKISKRQAQRAINYFVKIGWLTKAKRAYQSCMYYLIDTLVRVNLNCRRFFSNPLFSEEDVHRDVHVLGSYKEYDNIPSTDSKVPAKKAEEKPPTSRPIPEAFKQMTRLNDQQRDKLAETFSEYELIQALDDASWYKSQGKTIKNLFAFFWSRGKIIAKKMRGGI